MANLSYIEQSIALKTCPYDKRNCWKSIRQDVLKLQTILTRNTKTNALLYPTLCNLLLLDYENVDPLAYDTLINMIYSFEIIATTQNKFPINTGIECFNEPLYKSYSFLTATLFNENLKLDENKKSLLIDVASNLPLSKTENAYGEYPADIRYWILEHPEFEKDKVYLIPMLYKTHQIDYYDLITDFKRRSHLRYLTRMPF